MIAWVDKTTTELCNTVQELFLAENLFMPTRTAAGDPRPVMNEIDDSANEVYYDRDIIVLANPEMAGLPKWVIALLWPVALRPSPPLPAYCSFFPHQYRMT